MSTVTVRTTITVRTTLASQLGVTTRVERALLAIAAALESAAVSRIERRRHVVRIPGAVHDEHRRDVSAMVHTGMLPR